MPELPIPSADRPTGFDPVGHLLMAAFGDLHPDRLRDLEKGRKEKGLWKPSEKRIQSLIDMGVQPHEIQTLLTMPAAQVEGGFEAGYDAGQLARVQVKNQKQQQQVSQLAASSKATTTAV